MNTPYFFKKLTQISRDTWRQMMQAQLLMVASSLAYTTILSIIPLLAMSFAIFKAFGGLNKLYDTVAPFIISNLAEGASDEVISHLENFIDNAHASAVGLGGFLGLVFTSMSMLSSIEKAINRVWQTRITRSWFQRIATYWLFITLGPLAFAFMLGFATSTDHSIAQFLPSGTGIFMITVAAFFGIYQFVPNTRVEWRYSLGAAVFTSVLWNLARLGYNLYTSQVLTYSKIYGSLGAVPILLLWIYIVWVIILGGASLTAALQKRLDLPRVEQKEGDHPLTTTGDKPGARV